MKVRELIKLLERFDKDRTVVFTDEYTDVDYNITAGWSRCYNDEYRSDVSLTMGTVYKPRKMRKVEVKEYYGID